MLCIFVVERNRTECVSKLRQVLMSLRQNELLRLSQDVLTRKCEENDTICTDEKNLFIDLVAQEGSQAAQKQLLNLFLRHSNGTEEDVRRVLFHCIAMKDPVLVNVFLAILQQIVPPHEKPNNQHMRIQMRSLASQLLRS